MYLFIWLHQVSDAACRIFGCSMWDLGPRPGLEPGPPASGAWSLSHWPMREVPQRWFFFNLKNLPVWQSKHLIPTPLLLSSWDSQSCPLRFLPLFRSFLTYKPQLPLGIVFLMRLLYGQNYNCFSPVNLTSVIVKNLEKEKKFSAPAKTKRIFLILKYHKGTCKYILKPRLSG